MNKMISYFELLKIIRDETPPKINLCLTGRKMEYKYNLSGGYYEIVNKALEDDTFNFYLRDSLLDYESFNENIEIIEEDKPIIKELDEANENEYYYSQDNRYNELVDEVMYHQVKINEIIRYINKKESE